MVEGCVQKESNKIRISDQILLAEFNKIQPTLTTAEIKTFEEFDRKFASQILKPS